MTEDVKETRDEEPEVREIVELEWEQIKDIYEMREYLVSLQNYFRDFALSYEKNKASLLAKIVETEGQMYTMANEAKTTLELDESFVYDLKLPNKKEDKGYFVKRE